jgi:hypothetical protein
MITGAHAIVYSKDPNADRAFFRDVLRFPNVDAGARWLIFSLPPGEFAVHPSDTNDVHELFLMCDDIEAFLGAMGQHGLTCEPVTAERWGLLTHVRLPGGGRLGVYQPQHARPRAQGAARVSQAASRKVRAKGGAGAKARRR